MPSPVKLYQREMHDNVGFFPTWLPGDPIEVGDVGLLDGGRFRRLASVEDVVGMLPEVSEGQTAQDMHYTSSSGTNIRTLAKASAAGIATGAISLEFSEVGAFVFHASRLRPRQLKNRVPVFEKILEAYYRDAWKKNWILVDALYSAERATIVVSQDSSAQLTLAATVTGPLEMISLSALSDPQVDLSVASTRGKILHVVGAEGLHPLYTCFHIVHPFFRMPSVEHVRELGGEALDAFSRVAINELLDS